VKAVVTGGCGFIGRWLCRKLKDKGIEVVAYDSLDPQVHSQKPDELPGVATVRGNMLDRDLLARTIADADYIFHFAAAVGVGQSQYEIARYCEANITGNAHLLEILSQRRGRLRRLIVAGSMSAYGEGAYRCRRCGLVAPEPRPDAQLRRREWEMRCPTCSATVEPVGTSETKPLRPTSVYALTKKAQEELSLIVGKSYGFPVTVFRFFNVYGPGQSLSNPYTGVAAIFLSRLKNGKAPVVYEDGLQTRDFVSVHDIVQANLLAMDNPKADFQVFNVGTGKPTSILDVAETLSRLLGVESLKPEIKGQFRSGDIRHCYADITRISEALGYRPSVTIEDGFRELVEWARTAPAFDRFEQAQRELAARGLVS